MQLLSSRAVRSAAATAGILAVLDLTIGLPWPLWLAWAAITAWAVGGARRSAEPTT